MDAGLGDKRAALRNHALVTTDSFLIEEGRIEIIGGALETVKAEFIRAKARVENTKEFRMGMSLRRHGRLQAIPASDVLDRR